MSSFSPVADRTVARSPHAVLRRWGVALLFTGLFGPLPLDAQQDPTARAVDSLFARWNQPGTPGCAVAARQGDRQVLSRAYGMADLEHGVPNTPETVFEAGSVSKQLTAAAVVLLAEAGRLSLDDDVRKYVPEVPRYEEPITIRHLLNHTSGLRDWGTVVAAAGWPRTTRIHTHDHVLDVISRQRSLNYTPGAEYSYTNSGYNLLAVIAERVSGESLQEFSKRNIFDPLEMSRTQWRDDFTRVVADRATAYQPARGGGFSMLMPFENVYGNGGLLTTVGDLLRWTAALEQGTLGGPRFREEMHRRGRLNDGREIAYAGGLVIGGELGVPEVSHTGATAGYRAFLARFPQQGVAVALLCNVADASPGGLGYGVARVLLGEAARERSVPAAVELAPERLSVLAGLYRNQRTQEPLRLELRDGVLRFGRGARLVALSDSAFALAGGGDRLLVRRAADGRPTALRLLTDDGDEVRFEPVAEASPSPAQLRAYEGRYHSDEAEATYTVAVVEGALELRLRPGRKVRLTPAYADAFTIGSGGLVRFIRDPAGRVREMSFGMGRVRDLRLARVQR